ncbi:enoyl-CoA hydratase/isomerase family protein [Zavarzinia sp. CC-PAN008]|uniref:enoyl-CoA hydratase/isomerase family protein n=1 Tax=Zavarzinia sp. CC-PAN008 TaxID=3243332 RepID=UPI003F74823F
MSADPIDSVQSGPILTLRLNRPDQGNAISSGLRQALQAAIGHAARDASVRVIVLTSDADVFSIGADVVELSTLTTPEAEQLVRRAQALNEAMLACPKPILAAIKGPCIGAGLELALFADIRFARLDARFGLPGVSVGIVPNGGAIARLKQLIGGGAARALTLTGGMITAERAFMLGLVTNVANAAEFDDSIAALASHLAQLSPVALREIKSLCDLGGVDDYRAAHDAGARALAHCYGEGEAALRIQAMLGTTAIAADTTVH